MKNTYSRLPSAVTVSDHLSTKQKESVLASTTPKQPVLASAPPKQPVLASAPPKQSVLASTTQKESVLASTTPKQSVVASTTQKESVLPSTSEKEISFHPSTALSTDEGKFRWAEKDVLLLLSCYEKFEPRFRKKNEKTDVIWRDVSTRKKICNKFVLFYYIFTFV